MHRRFAKGLTVVSLVAAVAVAAFPAQIYWYFTHGTAAVIESADLDKAASFGHAATEARLVVKKGQSVWVHVPFTNPAQDGVFIDLIRLIWRADAKNIYVSQVDVYDVKTRIWSKTGNFKGYTGTDAARTTDWMMGKNWKLYGGLSVSLLISNRGNTDQGVSLYSVGAHGGVDTSHR